MKIVLATPMRDWAVGGGHHASCWPLMRACLDTVEPRFDIIDPRVVVDDDLVRARSRLVRIFLDETDGDKLLFVDSDIIVDVRALRGMLKANKDCIAATYPKKKFDEYGLARQYALRTEPQTSVEDDAASVLAVGLGFMLLSRELLTAMRDDLDEKLGADDEGKRTTMMFMLKFVTTKDGRRHMLPEDYSFCSRVKDYTDVWLYTGLGAPVSHEGHHVYVGKAQDVHPRTKSDVQIIWEDEEGLRRTWGDDIG